MSSRKPTVDDLDDVDDEDGAVEEEISEETDLTLVVETQDELILGSDPRLEGPIDPDDLNDDEIVGEEEV